MTYFVYALASLGHNYIYVGLTSNVIERCQTHQKGLNKTTRPYAPFLLIYTEECTDRKEARIREKYWKGGSGKKKLKAMRDLLL
ncbi:GIY-YIG nuclease family protein [Psychroflexus montanilacus]|uniref:GIY-YIG nuclease family protein n=1 Tax=Psychroflexus montanilacus TaxID=2873598 RepID=UPI001CCDF233|nr:GIY-YIG nuclease family protein [Psychroflexus montanilacus]MBZ9651648.1 GIY-YIG nuclease family protein [Psychroflexus montanilacus]